MPRATLTELPLKRYQFPLRLDQIERLQAIARHEDRTAASLFRKFLDRHLDEVERAIAEQQP
jgi:predicted DNA-binding protein